MSSTNPPANPYEYFTTVYARAGQAPPFDHTAMTLASVNAQGQPSSRVVLLKSFSPQGLIFFTHYNSRKGRELDANPAAAICFYWPWIDTQVRIEGNVEHISAEDSDAYFHSRPRISQCGALASHQSQPLESRETLLAATQGIDKQYADSEIPRPNHWGGYLLRPALFEFWHNGAFRLHDRFEYRLQSDGAWKIQRLHP